MTHVLFVGQQPETVNFSDPALPSGTTAEKIHAGIALALKQMADRGWHADLCLIQPDQAAGPEVERALTTTLTTAWLSGAAFDSRLIACRSLKPSSTPVHTAASGARIAFNTRPEDSADAAARWLPAN